MALNDTSEGYVLDLLKGFDVLSTVIYLGLGLLVTLFLYRYLTPNEKGAVRQLGGLSILSAWEFFNKRYDFIWANFGRDLHFRFNVLHHNIIVVRGEEARKTYFDNRSLHFREGYKLFLGGTPRLEDIKIEESIGDDTHKFNKRFLTIFNRDNIADMITHMFVDLDKRTATWGKQGQVDPFQQIYTIAFQLAARMTTCAELSRNFKEIDDIRALYLTLRKNSMSPASLLFPWFPSPATRRKERATKELFTRLHHYAELRRNAAVPTCDAFDLLLAQGMSNIEIVEFTFAVISAAVNNIGIASCWGLLFLSSYPEWKAKAKLEVNSLIEKHTSSTSSDPLHKRLGAIPISVWENEMPILDLVLRETIRHTANGASLRRNVLEDITLSGALVKRGEFIAYSLADAHMNPNIYTRPDEFDPGRFSPGREEDKKEVYGYLGWGAGRHPCIGMKFAKQEIKMIIAYMLVAFDFDVVDKFGKRPQQIPKPNRDERQQARPIGDPCYLKFKRVVE